jgi:HsdM N-terminal domain
MPATRGARRACAGGMDASQYKDYVLFMLFIKYVSDKYADYDGFEPPIVIPISGKNREKSLYCPPKVRQPKRSDRAC